MRNPVRGRVALKRGAVVANATSLPGPSSRRKHVAAEPLRG